MSVSLTVTEASRDLPAALDLARASEGGVVLVEGGEPVAKIVSVRPRAKTGREIAASWDDKDRLSPEEAEDFARDIEEARRQLPPLRDPWA